MAKALKRGAYQQRQELSDEERLMLTVILLGVCSLIILLIVVLLLFYNSGEGREQAEWCAEYMPEASRSECAAEAGW